eukprot:m.81028 g.81028  ORF g.81028 m.81028 type:complete len:235 (+) comp8215_c0_seq3:1043-1747(+)
MPSGSSAEDDAVSPAPSPAARPKARLPKALKPDELAAFQKAQDRRGIIYMSWVPPFMKPAKLKHLMSQYGEVDRIFLRPEDIKAWAKRKKMGGNKKRKYIEGWVEFLDKKIAKRVAATLNGTQIGGRKGSMYYDDLWVMKYLPRFKWHHLTERIAYDNAVRDQRLQLHMDQVRRETATFVENVAQSKKFKAMEERHSKKRKQQAQDVVEGESADEQEDAPSRTIRKVKQRVARV